MILVTVGTHPQGFERLVRPMDELASVLEEPVIIQYGSSSYRPRFAEGFDYTTGQEMERLTRQARLVVCHAAAGSLLLAIQHSKPVVAVPRMKRYGEHIDDHQLQLARALEAQGRVIAVYQVSPDNLKRAVHQVGSGHGMIPGEGQLVDALITRLGKWEKLAFQRIERHARRVNR